MKSLIVSTAVLLITFFSVIPASAVQEDRGPESAVKAQQTTQAEDTARKDTPDANSIADVNVAADANAAADANVAADANAMRGFRGLENTFERVNKSSRDEIREWMRSRLEHRITLLKAVQEQRNQEFGLLRELAVEEGAVKTIEAIDHLLAARRERYEDVISRTEQERKKLLRKEREEKERAKTERGRDQRRKGRQDAGRRGRSSKR